jgi:hypothetical protein
MSDASNADTVGTRPASRMKPKNSTLAFGLADASESNAVRELEILTRKAVRYLARLNGDEPFASRVHPSRLREPARTNG